MTACDNKDLEDATVLINRLWRLPALVHCDLNAISGLPDVFKTLIVTSTSIKSLSIESHHLSTKETSTLLKHTPYLQYLHATIGHDISRVEFAPITRLNIFIRGLKIVDLLRQIPQLHHLTVETHESGLNGDQWQRII